MDAADLAFAGLARQAELIRAGEVSSRELTELYLERIARLDPLLRATASCSPTRRSPPPTRPTRRRGDDAPPLNGVPIAIKDDTDVAGQVTARGSLGHGGPARRTPRSSRRLRAAGAVMLGKTHVPELEAMAATESLAFGATRNPWDPAPHAAAAPAAARRAAVAAGLAAAALGHRRRRLDPHPRGVLRPVRPQAAARPAADGAATGTGMSVVRRAHARRARLRAVHRRRAEPGPAFAAAARRAPGALRIAYSPPCRAA